MRVLLTGASGFIGSHSAHALSAAGHELRVLARPTSDLSGLDGLQYQRAVGDLRGQGLDDACRDREAVVHLAGVTSAPSDAEYLEINARGTGRLARAAAGAGVRRFLYISSIAAQGPSRNGQAPDPTAPCRPISAYGESKAAGEVEALVFRERMTVQVLRPPVVYGPRDTGLLPFFKMARWRYVVRLGNGENRLAMIYGQDLANAIVALLASDAGPSPLFHITDAEGPYTWNDLIDGLRAAFGHRVFSLPVPAVGFETAARLSVALARLRKRTPLLDSGRVAEMRQSVWLTDNAALSEVTNWAPRTSLTDGLRTSVAWYREHGWI